MPFNKKQLIAERRERVAKLYLTGLAQFRIAEIVGVTQAQVSYDLKKLAEKWQESALIDINEVKKIELARINNLEREYWESWNKSKQDHKQTVRKAKGNNKTTTYKEQTIKEVYAIGNHRFLQGVQWCIEKRCQIFGLDAPKQFENRIATESAVVILPDNFRDMSDEKLEQLANGK